MRVTTKGQVTIPIHMREQLGLLPETEVEFELDDRCVRIFRAKTSKRGGRGRKVVRRLRGRATVKLSTDEIMAYTREAS